MTDMEYWIDIASEDKDGFMSHLKVYKYNKQ
jgi:hypothetical protein